MDTSHAIIEHAIQPYAHSDDPKRQTSVPSNNLDDRGVNMRSCDRDRAEGTYGNIFATNYSVIRWVM